MTHFATRQDIINCYRLALGRDPESEAVIEDKLAQPSSDLLPDFFSSSEFEEGARKDIPEGSPPQSGFRLPPDIEIKAWAADFAPVSPPSRQAIRMAGSWAGLYRALFADEIFVTEVLTGAARATNRAFLSALAVRENVEAAIHIEGQVELVTSQEIRGWALDRLDPYRPLRLELWIDGVFRAATAPDRYRPELQSRFDGSGMFGFVMARPFEPQGAGLVQAELREARSGTVIKILQLPPVEGPPVDAVVALRRELAEVRGLLVRIEQRLPEVNEACSFALDLYADYFDACYAPKRAASPAGASLPDLAVIVDASSATPAELEQALASLDRQSQAPDHVSVTHPGGDLELSFEYVLSRWRGCFPDAQSPRSVLTDGGWAAAIQTAVGATDAPHLLLLEARSRLAPDASKRIDDALGSGAALVYADSDGVELLADGAIGRHRDPAFRTRFDSELFLQQGDLGPLVGLSRRFVDAVGWRCERDRAGLYDLILRGLHRTDLGGFVHIPRILSHSAGPSPLIDLETRAAALEDYLTSNNPGAKAAPHADILGATVACTFRVRQTRPEGARAAVIMPTRDRLDLLQPCLESLAATKEQNATDVEILIVDNQSQEPETFALLERFSRILPLRVIPHDGEFNWALINNLAAAETDADVLIFLNNDTAALTPDWCDELCSQALRPEVGAVGARLLYADGTIQHAGMVVGGWHAFVAHEGVGSAGFDPGYLGRHALLREVSAVTGACLATRRSVFEDLGGFDALNLPVEGNDVDYCFRLQAAGLKVLYDPYCTLYHFESKSRGLNLDRSRWSLAEAAGTLMRARWGETFRSDPFYNPHFDRASPPLSRLRPTLSAFI